MSNFKVNVKNIITGVEATFNGKDYVTYDDRLNDIDEANVKLPATTIKTRDLFKVGKNNKVKILRNGIIEFSGYIIGKSNLDAGGISLRCASNMALLSNDSYDTEEVWKLQPTSTIATDIITDTDFSVGTIENAFNLDFKTKKGNSYLNTLRNLRDKTNQDLYYTDATNAINLVDHKGSSTSIMVLNDGRDFVNPIFDTLEPKGNKVRVVGSGIGTQKIESEYPAHGHDATSQADYGIILYTETDPTIISVDEANKLADSLVSTYAKPVKSYKIDIINTSLVLESGDVITLNAPEKDIDAEDVRVVEIERGMIAGREFLTLTLANVEYSQALKKRNELLGGTSRKVRDGMNFEQNSTNVLTFSEMINANSSAPLRVKAYLSNDDIRDEAGNSSISSFLFDYDIDPFRSSVGTASETNVAPSVTGDTGNTQPGVSGDSGSTQPGVSGDTGDNNEFSFVGSDSFTTKSCSSGVWTTLASIYPGSSHINETLFANVSVFGSSGGDEDIQVRIGNYSVYGDIEPGNVGSGASVWGTYADGFRDTSFIVSGGINVGIVTSSSHNIELQVKPKTGALYLAGSMSLSTYSHGHSDGSLYSNNHDHADGTLYADNHDHADGTLAAGSHNHSVSIGDDVSDAGSINATGVTLFLDYWTGSAWVQKHSISTSSVTINKDVDLSNGGIYPDVAGHWQVRAYPNMPGSDLVQGILRVKHGVK